MSEASEAITITAETDRIYTNVVGPVTLRGVAGEHSVTVTASSVDASEPSSLRPVDTVVWNPWVRWLTDAGGERWWFAVVLECVRWCVRIYGETNPRLCWFRYTSVLYHHLSRLRRRKRWQTLAMTSTSTWYVTTYATVDSSRTADDRVLFAERHQICIEPGRVSAPHEELRAGGQWTLQQTISYDA